MDNKQLNVISQKKMQIKSMKRHHQMAAKLWSNQNSHSASGSVKWYKHVGKGQAVSQEVKRRYTHASKRTKNRFTKRYE